MRYEENEWEELFYELTAALQESRFPVHTYSTELIADFLLWHYEKRCERQDLLDENILDVEYPPFAARGYGALWENIISHSFSICKSSRAKRSMWAAIAQATISQDDPLLVKYAATLLGKNSQWMPKEAKEQKTAFFGGVYAPGDYRLTTLVCAVRRMQEDDAAGQEHIRQWLISLCLAPGVLPMRKHAAMPSENTSHVMRRNQTFWWEVVVPYCNKAPHDALLSERIFPYLPISPGEEEGRHLINSLPSMQHQQWAYANLLGVMQNANETYSFWKNSFPTTLTSSERDLRLHCGLLQVASSYAQELATEVDSPTVAMLESLNSYSRKTMVDLVYTRWLDQSQNSSELPQNWYDETDFGF